MILYLRIKRFLRKKRLLLYVLMLILGAYYIINVTSDVEHKITIGDVDRNGLNEIVASSDDLSLVNIYKFLDSKWEKVKLIQLPSNYWIWSIDVGNVDND